MIISCTHYPCEVVDIREDIQFHETLCKEREILCECGVRLIAKNKANHKLFECNHRFVFCKGCPGEFK